jgi:hypothetical protein
MLSVGRSRFNVHTDKRTQVCGAPTPLDAKVRSIHYRVRNRCRVAVARRARRHIRADTCRPNFMRISSLEPEICPFKVNVLVNWDSRLQWNPRLHTYETSSFRQRFRRGQCLSRKSFTSKWRNSGASDVNGSPMRRRAARLTCHIWR